MNARVKVTTNTPERKGADSASKKAQRSEVSLPTNSPIDQILHLQRTIGNRAVQRMFKSGFLQAKLRIGQSNDKYEQEADRVADQVMRISGPQVRSEEEGGSTATATEGQERSGRSNKVLVTDAEVEWKNPKKNIIQGGELYGLGRHRPHGMTGKWSECTIPPTVSVEYNDDERAWIIQSVTAYAEIDVQEPLEEAYPKYNEANPEDNNVVDNESLGTRTPPDRTGKGHWEYVIKNLLLYGTEDYVPQNMFWWVRGSTMYHEEVHHREYKEWFKGKWWEFRKQLGERLQEKLAKNQISPVNKDNVERVAQSILKRILEEDDWPITESQAYSETREKYWVKKVKEIHEFFAKRNHKLRIPIQRQVEEEEKRIPQIKQEYNTRPAVTPALESRIQALREGGYPLPESVRNYFGSRFSQDFSQVRMPTDNKANGAARSVSVNALTTGQNVVFGAGQYLPETVTGKQILVHELTPVVHQQQEMATGTGRVQRQEKEPETTYRLGMRRIRHPDERVEVEIVRPWKEGDRETSTLTGMAQVAEISLDLLEKDLVASGAYKSAADLRKTFKVGTRIVVQEGKIIEISVRDKVYKVEGMIAPDFDYFLREGAKLFGVAGFGLAGGEKAGPDPSDSYDVSMWEEMRHPRGVLRAKVSPWLAMDQLVRSIGKKVPKAGGGMTEWRFDCFEFVPLIRIYAYWRTMTKSEFNKKFSPLELGFHARTKLHWGETIEATRPGEAPFTLGEMRAFEKGGEIIFEPEKLPVGKSWAQLLREAPIGTQIVWTNKDAQAKCKKDPHLSFCNYENENATKLGLDEYSAHPFGIVNENTIKEEMAAALFGGNKALIPADYIEKNIYISSMRYPIR